MPLQTPHPSALALPDYGTKEEWQPGSGDGDLEPGQTRPLKRALQDRHMQMIAIGGAIGAGLFVGSGSALHTGGPGSLVLGYIIVGAMLLFTVQALAEMAVLFPINGAFFQYICRWIDPAWGFAMGWDYAIGWLIILPFEITAASLTIDYWRSDLNIGIWIAVFMTVLAVVQIFGVRGYGEVEFILSIIKIAAIVGFIILGVIIDCGGVPTDPRGYIGAHYWHSPGAFHNGFKGFCSVFVLAAFAFGGTELVGLAAAEAAEPHKSIPKAQKQIFWRIAFFYVVGQFVLGLIVPSDSDVLLNSTGANTKASPFVLAIKLAGIKVLPSIFNAVITISVISVANSATYASTRTLQALASQGMAPQILAYVDKKGRPLPCILLQLAFGLLAFINEAEVGADLFNWLLALGGLSDFFLWGSICLAHIRFRRGWVAAGHSLDEIPYRAPFGIYGSYAGLILNWLCLIAQFYVALFPVGGSPNATDFFQSFLGAFVILGLWAGWKVYSALSKKERINGRGWKLYVRTKDMDVHAGLRHNLRDLQDKAEADQPKTKLTGWKKFLAAPYKILRALF